MEAKLVIIYTDILVQAASVEAKPAIVFTDFFLLLLGQAASVDAMLAIVFTDIFFFWSKRACVRHPCGASKAAWAN